MTFSVTTLAGSSESAPSDSRLREILDELNSPDPEHSDVSLTHESEWCLSAFRSGRLVWENLEHGAPRHMRNVPRERVLDLWKALALGHIDQVDKEPWLPGHGD